MKEEIKIGLLAEKAEEKKEEAFLKSHGWQFKKQYKENYDTGEFYFDGDWSLVSKDGQYYRHGSKKLLTELGYFGESANQLMIAEDAAKIKAKQRAIDAKKQLQEIKEMIMTTGDCPVGLQPEGQVCFDTFSIHGTGDLFIIENSDIVWYLKNNGMDGDDWSRNNVKTGGAGAIGWRIQNLDLANQILELRLK